MVELELKDYKRLKADAEMQIKQATIMLEVNTEILKVAEKKIAGFPEEQKDANPTTNSG